LTLAAAARLRLQGGGGSGGGDRLGIMTVTHEMGLGARPVEHRRDSRGRGGPPTEASARAEFPSVTVIMIIMPVALASA
jgi:hypothetical protein